MSLTSLGVELLGSRKAVLILESSLNAREMMRGKHIAQTTTTLDSTGFELPKFRSTISGNTSNLGHSGGLVSIFTIITTVQAAYIA